jgi:mRNA interferase MazF
MTVKRGEVWLADLNPTRGSEQGGTRPVIIFQNDIVSQFSTTVITIPLTSNLRRAYKPICLLIPNGEGGLDRDSVALCYQLRVIDRTRLQRRSHLPFFSNNATIVNVIKNDFLTVNYNYYALMITIISDLLFVS